MKTLMSKILIKARQESKLSQAVAADKLGVSKMTVSSWEVGKTIPRKKSLNGISELYGLDLDYLTDKWEVSNIEISLRAKHKERIMKYRKRPSFVVVEEKPVGTEVRNEVEGITYIVKEGDVVLTNKTGKQWVITKEELAENYERTTEDSKVNGIAWEKPQYFVAQQSSNNQKVTLKSGEIAIAKKGDYFVCNEGDAGNMWVVKKEVFENNYVPR